MLLFKVREIRSPVSEHFRGYRMALCIPNESGFCGNPSFTGKFLVAESSDFTERPSVMDQLVWLRDNAGGEAVRFLSE